MKCSRKLVLVLLFVAAIVSLGSNANAQIAAAVSYGTFTVGGSSSSYYAVQFANNVTAYGSPTGANTSDLVIYRSDTHENGSWYGTFNFVVSFHPTAWGHFNGQIEKLIYQTGNGGPYVDPVGDIADGSTQSGGNDLIVWLKGGATYHWRNRETTAGWSLTNGNAAGGNIVDSSGVTRAPITAQSSLILNAKNNLYLNALGIGVNGSLKLTSGSGSSITFGDGSMQSTAWTGVLCGGDYAESVDVTGERMSYEPGDVLVIDPNNPDGFTKSAQPYSTAVAGVYSTKPGVIGRKSTDPAKAKAEIPMAMIGIVPTKVSAENGPIKRGDLLVTSATPGYAMKGTDRSQTSGAIVGKALGPLNSGTGVIEVLVSIQ